MTKFCPWILAAFSLATLSSGCKKREAPVAKIVASTETNVSSMEAGAPPANAEAAPMATPKNDADFLEQPTGAEIPPSSGQDKTVYEAWFKKHGLDLNDPAMLDADPDGDGATNRDEFLADTDPHDVKSRPGLHRLIRFKEYSEIRLPLILESVDGEKAQIRRTEGGVGRVETVRAGEEIRGLPLKVDRVESKHDTDKNGEPVDLSRVTLEDTATKAKVALVKDMPAKTSATFAMLASQDGRTTLKVHEGDVFTWPGETGATYRVIDLSRDQVVLQQIETKKMWTIPRM